MEPRTAANKKSIKATLEFLRELLSSKSSDLISHELLEALKSQGTLAKYENASKGIKGMSLNTFKMLANEEISGGFPRIDELRKQVLNKLQTGQLDASQKASKASKTRDKHSLEDELGHLRAANIVLLRAVANALNDLRSGAEARTDAVRKRLASEAVSRIHASLTANSPPYDTESAVELSISKSPQ